MLDLAIVGAGPCGLATAAVARRAGLDYLVLDRGCVVHTLTRFPTTMTFFSTSEKLAIAGIPFVSARANPTRQEALDYYRQVADALGLTIRQYQEVLAVEHDRDVPGGAEDTPSFRVITRSARDPDAGDEIYRARAVVLATGYYDNPNRLGVPGEDLPHVSHYFTEAHPFYRQRVVVVGGRNSAVEAALELHRAGARVTLVHRGPDLSDRVKPWVLPFIRKRLEAGDIAARFNARVTAVEPDRVILEQDGRPLEEPADFVFLLTGYRPDHRMLKRLGVPVNPDSGAPVHDPDSMETPVRGLYVAGVLAAGYDANKIFIENGRFHGERIIAHLLKQRGLPDDEISARVRYEAPAAMRTGAGGQVDF
ncbi:MAG TPA: YpdA family putative bacillithiol disulfide reductase [Bacillota bacterium]